jgi:hypothetical protein
MFKQKVRVNIKKLPEIICGLKGQFQEIKRSRKYYEVIIFQMFTVLKGQQKRSKLTDIVNLKYRISYFMRRA